MARPREPIDLVKAKGRKHLTKAEYEQRKKSGSYSAVRQCNAACIPNKEREREI